MCIVLWHNGIVRRVCRFSVFFLPLFFKIFELRCRMKKVCLGRRSVECKSVCQCRSPFHSIFCGGGGMVTVARREENFGSVGGQQSVHEWYRRLYSRNGIFPTRRNILMLQSCIARPARRHDKLAFVPLEKQFEASKRVLHSSMTKNCTEIERGAPEMKY